MASTYSTNLALELIGTGDQAGTWGNTTNTNLGTLIEQAISGYVTQAVTTGNTTTLTIPDGASGVARNMYIELTGTGGASTVLAVPVNKKLYFIFNNASGAVTVKVTGQTGVSVAAGEKKILVSNGTDIVEATSYLINVPSSITVTTLNATSANITTLTGTTLGYTSANITTVTGTTLGYTSANITTVTGTTLGYTSANITTATGTTFSATTMGGQSTTTFLGTSANITTVTGTTAGFTSANITTLSGTNFSATSLTLTNALGRAQGGTGVSTAPTNGQLLIGNGTDYTLATITAGSGITVTNGTGTITLAAGGLPAVVVSNTTTISATADNHYVLTATSLTTVTLPASPTISDTIYVTVANGLTTNVVARNGKNIQGIAEDMTLNAPYASAQLRYSDATEGWVLA